MAEHRPGEWTDDLLTTIAASVKARDFAATAALLRMLAIWDPQAAEVVMDALGRLGVTL